MHQQSSRIADRNARALGSEKRRQLESGSAVARNHELVLGHVGSTEFVLGLVAQAVASRLEPLEPDVGEPVVAVAKVPAG